MSEENPVPLSRLPDFDPRRVPVAAVDAHLPQVAASRLRADALRQRFAAPPAWQPELRAEPRFTDRAPAAAAVLVPLVLREQPTLLLTQRTLHMNTHSGQVAFPGGKADPDDVDAAATALREAEEEIGLARTQVEVLGYLPDHLVISGFRITPVVALVAADCALTLDSTEVEEIFELPLGFLLDARNHVRRVRHFAGEEVTFTDLPYGSHNIWGATAGMLLTLYRLLHTEQPCGAA